MALDEDMKKLAIEYGEQIFNEIYVSQHDPQKKIEGETLKIYNELEDWGWLNDVPIDDPRANDIYIKMIAMQKYRHLRWRKAHPPKKKLSKWEIVTGGLGRRR